MTLMRPLVHRDANHAEIKAALVRAFGSGVIDTAHLGHGWPDLIVAVRGRVVLVEIKRPGPRSARKLRPAQQKIQRWADCARVPYLVVQSAVEAIESCNAV